MSEPEYPDGFDTQMQSKRPTDLITASSHATGREEFMSDMNEPEGALKLAVSMVKDLLHTIDLLRGNMKYSRQSFREI